MARSSYPSISLEEAVIRVKQVYDNEGTNPADREAVAAAMGYTSRNGASDSTIAGVLHYGLLEASGKQQLKISRLGLDIILGERGDIDRGNAIKTASMQPELFVELSSQYGDGKFSNKNLENYLIKNGFNPQAAAKATKSYRETMDFVNSETSMHLSDIRLVEDATYTPPIAQPIAPMPQVAEAKSPDQRSAAFLLSDGTSVDVIFENFSEENLEELIEHLTILVKRFAKRRNASGSNSESISD